MTCRKKRGFIKSPPLPSPNLLPEDTEEERDRHKEGETGRQTGAGTGRYMQGKITLALGFGENNWERDMSACGCFSNLFVQMIVSQRLQRLHGCVRLLIIRPNSEKCHRSFLEPFRWRWHLIYSDTKQREGAHLRSWNQRLCCVFLSDKLLIDYVCLCWEKDPSSVAPPGLFPSFPPPLKDFFRGVSSHPNWVSKDADEFYK